MEGEKTRKMSGFMPPLILEEVQIRIFC